MSKRVFSFAAGVAVATVFGCASEGDVPELGQLSQALDRVPNAGFLPYPIKVEDVTKEPLLNPDGSYQPAWDGSLADLMAADAYASCAMTSGYRQHNPMAGHNPGNDAYLQHLTSKMFGIGLCGYPASVGPVLAWDVRRADKACNIDPLSNKPVVVDDFEREETTPFKTFYDSYWGVTATSAVATSARQNGGLELEYADLNLCMAQRLREQLNGGQSLFTSTEDHTEILAVIRERAQLAVLWYSMLVKLFASTDPGATSIDSGAHEFPVLIRRWFASTDSATKERIADDFADAIQLHIQTVHELAALFQRQAGTRPVGDAGLDRADRDWGVGQPRHRLLNLLYGGDPIGAPSDSPPAPGRGSLHAATEFAVPGYVKVDMSDPRVQTLLGLGREADALFLKFVTTTYDVGFDEVASGERLYRQVEVRLRSQACGRDTPANPACLPSAIEAALPLLNDFQEYRLWQEHHIEPRHALTLATALAQAFTDRTHIWLFGPNNSKLHLFGAHSRQTIAGASWLRIDKNFTTRALAGHELMEVFNGLSASSLQLPRTMDPLLDGRVQGFVMAGGSGWGSLREMGAVPALILAREAMLLVSSASSLAPFVGAATPLLSELERAIGPRQAVLRNTRDIGVGPCASEPSVQCKNAFPMPRTFDVQVVTQAADPLNRFLSATQTAQLNTIAADPGTVGFNGLNRASLDASATSPVGTQESYTGFAAGYQRRSRSYSNTTTFYKMLLLRGADPANPGAQAYMPLFMAPSPPNVGVGMQFHSFGGSLHRIAERAMSVQSHDWSRPAFDGFGLPADWVPPADASLVGGAPGEPSYQYYLRKAKDAAQEATAAVQVAIDSLVEETLQAEQLDAAETRAATISELETRALCGPNASCNLPVRNWDPAVKSCSTDASGEPVLGADLVWCNRARDQLLAQLPSFPLASAVVGASGAAATFESFEGSEAQRILIQQWNAKRSLQRAVDNAIDLAIVTGRETAAARATALAAAAEFTAARAAVDAELAELCDPLDPQTPCDSQLSALIAEYENAQAEIDAKLNATYAVQNRECDATAYEDAYRAGSSFSGKPKGSATTSADGLNLEWTVNYDEGRTWSPGPVHAQLDRCEAAHDDVAVATALAEPAKAVLQQKIDLLIARTATNPPSPERIALFARQRVADRIYDAARATARGSQQSAWAQIAAQLTQVQQAIGELLAASAELSQVQLRVENAVAAAKLEQHLVENDVEARFGIRRKFRSYDTWRARALLESARRLSVAARRSIESRFVVDLSELEAPQAFVAPPAIWADEVYRADLNTPSVVGLTVAPTGGGGIAPNQLLDYVENLERFVQGYTVTYPTSVALPDAEVLVLSGPAVTEEIDGSGAITEVLSDGALGWSFYCPESDGWFPHPVIGTVSVVGQSANCGSTPAGGVCTGEGMCAGRTSCDCRGGNVVCGATLASRLGELCGGRAPTRARCNFSLDPWGRLNGALRSMPLEQRHNVRWGRLAVNLVGTGIRDCQRAASPATCFSESFVRFQLQHSGPAWMTNHAQQWRAFELPTAFIENGKALASEEWLDPIANGYTSPFVASVARGELLGRPIHGGYELTLELGPELRPERIERVQLLVESEYWVRQQ